MVVWRCVEADAAPALAALWVRATARRDGRPVPGSPDGDLGELLRDRLSVPGALCLVGEDGGELVACGMGAPLQSPGAELTAAHLSLLAVTPARWGTGLGRELLARLEQQLVTVGFRRGELHVLTANGRARRLYEAAGWSVLREDLPHRDGPQLVYGKEQLGRPGRNRASQRARSPQGTGVVLPDSQSRRSTA